MHTYLDSLNTPHILLLSPLAALRCMLQRCRRRACTRTARRVLTLLQRLRRTTRYYILRAVYFDFLPCFRVFQALGRLSLGARTRIHLLQIGVHAFGTFLARFRRINFGPRATGTLARLVFLKLPGYLVRASLTGVPAPLLYSTAHRVGTNRVLTHITLRNYHELICIR